MPANSRLAFFQSDGCKGVIVRQTLKPFAFARREAPDGRKGCYPPLMCGSYCAGRIIAYTHALAINFIMLFRVAQGVAKIQRDCGCGGYQLRGISFSAASGLRREGGSNFIRAATTIARDAGLKSDSHLTAAI